MVKKAVSQSGCSAPPPCARFISSNPSTWTTDTEPAALFSLFCLFFPLLPHTSLHLGNATTCAAHFLSQRRVRADRSADHTYCASISSTLSASQPDNQPAMETGVMHRPKWTNGGSRHLFLLVLLCYSPTAEAEITCRSCQSGNKWRAQEILLKFDASESSAAGLKGELYGHGDEEAAATTSAGIGRLRCAQGSAQCALERTRLKRNTESQLAENVKLSGGDGGRLLQGKRTRRDITSSEPVQSEQPGEGTGSAGGRRAPRSELRWSGEERRAAASRQEELKVNSSTFALTGDSSHNQAMVHWSGQNSSVSARLCRLEASLSYLVW